MRILSAWPPSPLFSSDDPAVALHGARFRPTFSSIVSNASLYVKESTREITLNGTHLPSDAPDPRVPQKRLIPAAEDQGRRIICGCLWSTAYFRTGMQ